MKAILIDVYDNTSEEILTADSWKEMSSKIDDYIKNALKFESHYSRVIDQKNNTIRIDFGSHYKFIDVDVSFEEIINNVETIPNKTLPQKDERHLTLLELLEETHDILECIEASKECNVPKERIKKLKDEVSRNIHYLK
jgi:hypothetical protein